MDRLPWHAPTPAHLCLSTMCHGIKGGIGRAVVGLTGGAQQGRHRGEEQLECARLTAAFAAQLLQGRHLGCPSCAQALQSLVAQRGISQHTAGMQDANHSCPAG